MVEALPADPKYVAARRVLIHALETLTPHRDALIVAGAQAIYLHTGSMQIDETIAPYTTDGDLAVNPSLLGDDPRIEVAMEAAGFQLQTHHSGHVEPGIWIAPTTVGSTVYDVPVDLIVPEGASTGGGRRAARLAGHGRRTARRAVGLEAALVDHSPMTITALEPEDNRSIVAKVAGVAAMFVAKAHKLNDRIAASRTDRLDDKDAADVIRLMQSTPPTVVAERLNDLVHDATAGSVTESALAYLDELFGRREGAGVKMAIRAMRLAVPARRVEAISVAYTSVISEVLRRG